MLWGFVAPEKRCLGLEDTAICWPDSKCSEDQICALAWDGTWDLGVTSCGQARWSQQPLNGLPASSTSEVLPGLEGPSRNCLKILFVISPHRMSAR